jgi:hydrogenase expression/formation protein HypD
VRKIVEKIGRLTASIGGRIRLMEVCGTHTVVIFRNGIRELLPAEIELLSGPGCPVCVTSLRDIDKAVAISREDRVILVTFGDMMRVPGSRESLLTAKAAGGDIRIAYSPLDALELAKKNPDRQVVFFATGFETTSPSVAATLVTAVKSGIENFFVYPVHKTVPPALRALLDSGDLKIDGLILPGHVSAIIGSLPYNFIAAEYGRPSVVTGFEAVDILEGILMLLEQLSTGRSQVEIQYARVVKKEGNPKALSILSECFESEDAEWRGLGIIPGSGLRLRDKFVHRDIRRLIDPVVESSPEPVLRGVKLPTDCRLFGRACTPEKPVGACMVSSEGSCAAYYRYRAISDRRQGG